MMPALNGRKMSVLYGSQYGSAEDVAKRIGRHAKRHHFSTEVLAMDDYDISKLLSESLVIFVCSTTGQGEEPDNMKRFWKFILRKNLPENSLTHLHYSVVGMGDSSYIKFNFVAKKLYKRIQQLGGIPILPLALADDQHELGPDAAIDPWLDTLWDKLLQLHPLPNGLQILSENEVPPSQFKVESLSDRNFERTSRNCMFENGETPFSAVVLSNERETSESHFQDVRLIRFRVDGIKYKPGDVAVVRPRNLNENVEAFLSLLPVPEHYTLHLSPRDENASQSLNFPASCTIRDCVQLYWDIMSVPKRSFFELLRHFSRSDMEKEKLEEFCTAEGQEELYFYCNRPRRSILEVLQDFPETTPHVPFEYFFDLMPTIRPRHFSIASSLAAHPAEVHLLVAVVMYRTRLQKERRGLCSTWLSTLNPGDTISIGTRPGAIKLAPITVPVIMVGPGTGCAPFRAFVQKRICEGAKGNVLFFGCRNEKGDFLCSDDWLSLVRDGWLHLCTAFSRDQDEKVYVQDKMWTERDRIWSLIHNESAWFYIAGNAKQMPKDVQAMLKKIVETCGHMDASTAEKYLTILEKSQRLQVEVWA